MVKRNIVLDLDSTLIFTFDRLEVIHKLIDSDDDLSWLSSHSYIIEMNDPEETGTNVPYIMWGLYRPYLTEFATYVIENFDNVYIWSAGKRKYVNAIIDNIFPPLAYNPPIILDFEHTNVDSVTNEIVKPLEEIYKLSGGKANESNTYVLDDRKDTFSLNVKNGILAPKYEFEEWTKDTHDEWLKSVHENITTDTFLKELICFFDKNEDVEDVRTLNLSDEFPHTNTVSYIDRIVCDKRISPSHNIRQ